MESCHLGYMLDTNIFNRMVELDLDFDAVIDFETLVVTEVQKEELVNTRDRAKRSQLLSAYIVASPTVIRDNAQIWSIDLEKEVDLEKSILDSLDSLKHKSNNHKDARIAACCKRNNLCLVTEDRDLRKIATNYSIATINYMEFLGFKIGQQ